PERPSAWPDLQASGRRRPPEEAAAQSACRPPSGRPPSKAAVPLRSGVADSLSAQWVAPFNLYDRRKNPAWLKFNHIRGKVSSLFDRPKPRLPCPVSNFTNGQDFPARCEDRQGQVGAHQQRRTVEVAVPQPLQPVVHEGLCVPGEVDRVCLQRIGIVIFQIDHLGTSTQPLCLAGLASSAKTASRNVMPRTGWVSQSACCGGSKSNRSRRAYSLYPTSDPFTTIRSRNRRECQWPMQSTSYGCAMAE